MPPTPWVSSWTQTAIADARGEDKSTLSRETRNSSGLTWYSIAGLGSSWVSFILLRAQGRGCAMDHEICDAPHNAVKVHAGRNDWRSTNYTWRFVAMGKGDRKSRKGKIWRNSYGKTRPHKEKKK